MKKTLFICGLFILINTIFSQQRFIINNNGTITDTKTGLMWQRELYFQNMNWYKATDYAKKLRLAGFSDWRLPTINELITLINAADRQNKADWLNIQGFKGLLPYWFWSSSEHGSNSNMAWYMHMDTGLVYYYDKNNVSNYYALVVRTVR